MTKGKRPRLKLADFGQAKLLEEDKVKTKIFEAHFNLIFVTEKSEIKICVAHKALHVQAGKFYACTRTGTACYMAPEV